MERINHPAESNQLTECEGMTKYSLFEVGCYAAVDN